MLVAEGVHLAQEALASGARIEVAVVSPRLHDDAEGRALERQLREAGVAVEQTSEATMDALQDARSPQPVLVVARVGRRSLDEVLSAERGTPLIAVACGVQDPGNLGAVLRTAEAAGATGFVSTPGSADLTHPRAVRATMGSIFRMPACEAPLASLFDRAARAGLEIVGSDAHAATSYDAFDWGPPLALLLGGEGAGLPAEAAGRLHATVAIPMAAGVESLSVGAAAAVLLFEAARARRQVSRAG